MVSEKFILPINVRITIPILVVGIIAIFFNYANVFYICQHIGFKCRFTHYDIVFDKEHIVRIEFFGKFRNHFHSRVCLNVNLCIAFLSTLCGNKYNTVCALHTVNRRCRSILKNRNTLHGRNVHCIHRTLNTVHKHERVGVVPRSLRSDDDFWIFLSRHTS